jgi:tetratricopeptide (TPR) repeat protein
MMCHQNKTECITRSRIRTGNSNLKHAITSFLFLTLSLLITSINSNCTSGSNFEASSEEKYQITIEDGVKYFGEGYLKYREGIPFIHLKGASYEIGLQYGALLREEMRSFYTHVEQFEKTMMDNVYKQSPWYKDILIRVSYPFTMRSKLKSFKKRAPDDLLAQLKGMSDGSGVPFNKILCVAFGPDFVFCSSFISNAGGRIIHGRNADHGLEQFFAKYPLIAHYAKDGKYSYIDIGIIGTPFAVTGINEHGLTLSWSQATFRPFKGKGTMLMFNKILEECRNLNDVDKMSKNVDRFVTMIGSLEDRTGAAYDIVDQKVARVDLENGYIYATNRCVSPAMRKEYNSIFDMDWSNSAREYTFQKTFSAKKEFTVDDAIRLLSNTDFYHYTGRVPPYEGGNINNNQTGSSAVLDPENCTVYFAYGNPYCAFYKWFKYNYKTDEFAVYKNEDDRLNDPDVVEYMEVERRWKDVDWENKDDLRQMVIEIEGLSVENFWTLHNSCWAWYNLGDSAKAEAIINRQIEEFPDFLSSYSNMGFLRMFQKRRDDAVEYFKKALEAPITNERKQMYCYEQLAAIYAEIGEEAKSRDCYSKVLGFYNRYWIPERSRKEVNRIKELLGDRS